MSNITEIHAAILELLKAGANKKDITILHCTTEYPAPFEDINKSTYKAMMKSLTDVDLTNIVEVEDETDLAGELACAGGACEIV